METEHLFGLLDTDIRSKAHPSQSLLFFHGKREIMFRPSGAYDEDITPEELDILRRSDCLQLLNRYRVGRERIVVNMLGLGPRAKVEQNPSCNDPSLTDAWKGLESHRQTI